MKMRLPATQAEAQCHLRRCLVQSSLGSLRSGLVSSTRPLWWHCPEVPWLVLCQSACMKKDTLNPKL